MPGTVRTGARFWCDIGEETNELPVVNRLKYSEMGNQWRGLTADSIH